MTKELKKDLERYGRVEMDTVTWVPVGQWYNYWKCYTGLQDREPIIAELSKKYPGYLFGMGEAHCNNIIYQVITIYKKKQ